MENNKSTQPQTEGKDVYYIYLKMDPYLAQWLIFKHGGEPIEFTKNSIENDIIGMGLTTPPPPKKKKKRVEEAEGTKVVDDSTETETNKETEGAIDTEETVCTEETEDTEETEEGKLDKPDDLPGEGKVAIVLPYFKYKDVRYYNFLPVKARDSLVQCLRARFAVELWKDLYKFGYIGKQKKDLIYAWMASHGIEDTETNFLAISKMYYRKRDAFRKQVKPNPKKG